MRTKKIVVGIIIIILIALGAYLITKTASKEKIEQVQTGEQPTSANPDGLNSPTGASVTPSADNQKNSTTPPVRPSLTTAPSQPPAPTTQFPNMPKAPNGK